MLFHTPEPVRNEFNTGIGRFDLIIKNEALLPVISNVKYGDESFRALSGGIFRYLAEDGFDEDDTHEDLLSRVTFTLNESLISNELRTSVPNLGQFGIHAYINFSDELRVALGSDLTVQVRLEDGKEMKASWSTVSKLFTVDLTNEGLAGGDIVIIEVLFEDNVIMAYEKAVMN